MPTRKMPPYTIAPSASTRSIAGLIGFGASIALHDCLSAIRSASEVHVSWDGEDLEVLFQFGIAFALNKPTVVLDLPPATPHKSFQNMVRAHAAFTWTSPVLPRPLFGRWDAGDVKAQRTFLISPVRGADQAFNRQVVESLEADGWLVHWPARDTDQNDDVGLSICNTNLCAVFAAHQAHFVWDGKSQGCIFDLGMAIAKRKTVTPVHLPPAADDFSNTIASILSRAG